MHSGGGLQRRSGLWLVAPRRTARPLCRGTCGSPSSPPRAAEADPWGATAARLRGLTMTHPGSARHCAPSETIKIIVRPRSGSRPVCSGCHQPAPAYDHLKLRRFEFVRPASLVSNRLTLDAFCKNPFRLKCRGATLHMPKWSEPEWFFCFAPADGGNSWANVNRRSSKLPQQPRGGVALFGFGSPSLGRIGGSAAATVCRRRARAGRAAALGPVGNAMTLTAWRRAA